MTEIEKAVATIDQWATDWTVTVDYGTFTRIAEACGGYNGASVSRLQRLADYVAFITPVTDFGTDNPNNGMRTFTLTFGREQSRVVYVRLLDSLFPDDFDPELVAHKIALCGYELGADEVDITENGSSYKIRIWWD